MNPLMYGEYPNAMKETVGPRLPKFTCDEARMVRGSYDFIALNHYYSISASHMPSSWFIDFKDFISDIGVNVNCKQLTCFISSLLNRIHLLCIYF